MTRQVRLLVSIFVQHDAFVHTRSIEHGFVDTPTEGFLSPELDSLSDSSFLPVELRSDVLGFLLPAGFEVLQVPGHRILS